MSRLNIPTAEVYRPLDAPGLRYLGAYGGRGSSKSHYFGGRMIREMIHDPRRRFVCIREVQKSLKESAYRLLADKIEAFGVASHFRVMNDRIETNSGGLIIFQGMQDHTSESIKSLEGFSAWVEEAQTMTSRSLEMLRPTIRAEGSQIWFSWNPRLASDPVDKFMRGDNPPPNSCCVCVNWSDNPWFPKELKAELEFDRRTRPDRYGHIWLGEYEPQAVGAIWQMRDIDDNRVDKAPNDLKRILIAIDPAVSNEENSDEHGIVAVGLDERGHGYVLEDASTKGPPDKWARRAIALYDYYRADAIVIEKNQGGDMCRHVLESVRKGIRIVEVHATRGKHVRAEPIAALYTLGRIHHVGNFPILEAQMCQMTASGYDGEGSPDHCDAMVWGMTEIFPELTASKRDNQIIRPSVADMNYSVLNYESNNYRGRQTVAISE